MKIKIFYPNPSGRLEFSKEELEELLNEAYQEGYRDGNNTNYYGIITPYSFGGTSSGSGDNCLSTVTATANSHNNDKNIAYLNGGLTVSELGSSLANSNSDSISSITTIKS